MKSSKRGSSILKAVPSQTYENTANGGGNTTKDDTHTNETPSPVVTFTTAPLVPEGFIYGWKPDFALQQISMRPHESWLIYQAQSLLRKTDVTLKEAQELFSKVSVTTRQPIQTSVSRRPSGFVAALRALFGGGMILLASGCVRVPDNTATTTYVAKTPLYGTVSKFYDKHEGVVCYVAQRDNSIAINCMVAKPGDNQ